MHKYDDFIEQLKIAIEDFEYKVEAEEFGIVKKVGDGIALVEGLNKANLGSVISFLKDEDGIGLGMVFGIDANYTHVVLLNKIYKVRQGTKCFLHDKQLSIPCSKSMLGRVIDPLGNPIDKGEEIKGIDEYRPIEAKAPGIMERMSVCYPLQTGVKVIDSLVPIGLGQKELILGDRQSGKTTIGIDAILNQKQVRERGSRAVYCIYVAIGQKNSTVAKIYDTLVKANAMEYTIIVSAPAASPTSLRYIAPMSATSIAEYFRDQGEDVLIVFDDLSKHANAYREISLLMKKTPSRGAYPGDIFFLHSRLLERAVQLKTGGSITMLPIIETQSGDLSDFIPTNVISITDGQIYLDKKIFFNGQKPAVNTGASVSRIGSSAQFKAMKQIAGRLKGELAQFQECEEFAKSITEIDKTAMQILQRGRLLMKLFQQEANRPVSFEKMIISLFAGTKGLLDNVTIKDEIHDFEQKLIDHINKNNSDILDTLNEKYEITEEMEKKLIEIIKEFLKDYVSQSYEAKNSISKS